MEINKAHDFYKPNGIIILKIEKFSKFVQKGEDARRLSMPIYVQGVQWKILAGQKDYLETKYLSYFLQCSRMNKDTTWTCNASAILKVQNQKEGKEDHIQKFQHNFNSKQIDWGFKHFMAIETLMDFSNGFYDLLTDSIILRTEIDADIPVGLEMPSRLCEDEDMGNLFDQRDEYSDCTLVSSDGVKFKVYKGILACRSPVFAAMFRNKEMIEAQNGIVDIPDIRAEVLEHLLRFIYSRKQPNMEENIAEELLAAADKYEIIKLKMFCERKLTTFLDDENACGLLVLADQQTAKKLKAAAIKHIRENAKKVRQTEGWKMMVKGNHGELLDQIVEAIIE